MENNNLLTKNSEEKSVLKLILILVLVFCAAVIIGLLLLQKRVSKNLKNTTPPKKEKASNTVQPSSDLPVGGEIVLQKQGDVYQVKLQNLIFVPLSLDIVFQKPESCSLEATRLLNPSYMINLVNKTEEIFIATLFLKDKNKVPGLEDKSLEILELKLKSLEGGDCNLRVIEVDEKDRTMMVSEVEGKVEKFMLKPVR